MGGLSSNPATTEAQLSRTNPSPCRHDQRTPTVISLWKDAVTGAHEIAIEEGACGVLLSLHVVWRTEWAADGRDDGGAASLVVQNGWSQVKTS
jgi:hypothetical protein